ncbi:MAG TPA: bifunctional phosphopantothenoylcysteine decarboxylase/phosphopantothenate--cysteine ligase CoaBC [Gammaproteobacteria bacterium]|nr:bifunctional phosphopantothenoylcysteine decarboxylase/phosphopantothenate--cysteine ligase CoaBC [Gammaproteobacteria bacterium]
MNATSMNANADLRDRHILLGVTGGIAAYKSPDLVRRLRDAGAEVQVVMTPAAHAFITALTLQAVSGRTVRDSLTDPAAEAAMGHIELARWADDVVVAPASADFMARLAHGMADDLLSTLCLATEAPIWLAPAMNRMMWANPATRDNCAVLRRRGVTLLGPGEGDQACGEVGSGRMLEPLDIVGALRAGSRDAGDEAVHASLQGLSVMVTAGPTREPIDPVRYVSNRSSGKMGYAVAAAAARAGARVTLVSGPVILDTPPGVERVDVATAEQMREAVLARVQSCDVFIAAAAVADYRPARPAEHKVKKEQPAMRLDMERTRDILGEVAALPGGPFSVGFAAETRRVAEYARAKLEKKGLDMIAANLVDDRGRGFDSDDNALHLFWAGGERELPSQPKSRLAAALVDVIAERYRARQAA